MTIPTERLLEIRNTNGIRLHDDELFTLAAELLAARESMDSHIFRAEHAETDCANAQRERDAAIARADGLAADLAACVVRAEKAEAERDREAREAAGYQRIAKEAADAEKSGTLVLLVSQDGAEVRIFGPDRGSEEHFGEIIARWWKLVQVVGEDLDSTERAKKAEAEVERLRAELDERNAYRDRTEAALVELTSYYESTALCERLQQLGLGRDAKGGAK